MVFSQKLAERYASLHQEAGSDCVLLMQVGRLEGEPAVSRDGLWGPGSAQPRPPCMAANADNTDNAWIVNLNNGNVNGR